MFKTNSYIISNLKKSINDYLIIWPQIVIFQIFARLLQLFIFSYLFGYLIDWNLSSGISTNLSNFDILNSILIDRFITSVFIFGLVAVFTLFFEYLGIVYICDTFYFGKEISLRKTIKRLITTSPRFIQSIFLQIIIYLSIIITSLGAMVSAWSIFPSLLSIPLIIIIGIGTIALLIYTLMRLIYVNFKIFDKHLTVFGLFDYKLSRDQLKERFLFSFFVGILTILGVLAGGALFSLSLSTTPRIFESIRNISVVSSLIVSISIIISTVVNFVYNGVLTLYRSRVYHLEFSKIVEYEPGSHDYSYESRAVRIWKNNRVFIIVVGVLGVLGFVLVQSVGINNDLRNFLGRDFITMSHRGSPGFAENTIESVNKSIEEKIDMVEVDLQITRDGEIILFHDETLGKVNSDLLVANSDYSYIQTLSFPDGERIPNLDQLLEVTRDKIGLNLEIKLYGSEDKVIFVDKVLSALDEYETNRSIIITSLDYEIVQLIENRDGEIDTGLIIAASIGDLDQFDTDWFMVNDIFYSANRSRFMESEKKIALWSFSPSWDGSQSFSDGLDGGITDLPSELRDTENNYADLPIDQKIIQALLWSLR